MKKIYLKSPTYVLNNEVNIASSDISKEWKEKLLSNDYQLSSYWTSDQNCYDMAKKAVEKTLNKAKIEASKIDTVIFSSDSIDTANLNSLTYSFFNELRLHKAYPILISMAECCNFQSAAKVAYSLVYSGQSDNTLVICVDRTVDHGVDIGYMVGSFGAFSDSAACCLLTSSIEGKGFEVLPKFHSLFKPSCLADGFYTDTNSVLKVFSIVKDLFRKAYQDWGVNGSEIKKLLTNNTTISEVGMFASSANIDFENCYTENIAKVAHSFSADNIINLADCMQSCRLLPNDLVLLMASGRAHWACFLLKYLT